MFVIKLLFMAERNIFEIILWGEDKTSFVGMGWGREQNKLPCHSLVCILLCL